MTVQKSLNLPEPKPELLFRAELRIGGVFDIGLTPEGRREIITYASGSFTGPRLSGTVLGCSGVWRLKRADGVILTDGKYVLKTDRGEILNISSSGASAGGDGLFQEKLIFKTGSTKFMRLNHAVVIGVIRTGEENIVRLEAFEIN